MAAVEDPELYHAWLETMEWLSRGAPEAERPKVVVTGEAGRVHATEGGVALRYEFRNPDLEGQEERLRFWGTLLRRQRTAL